MQPLERYGVVALVLIAVTVSAVLLWERDREDGPDGVVRAGHDVARVDPTREGAFGAVRPKPRGLTRDPEERLAPIGRTPEPEPDWRQPLEPVPRADEPIVTPVPREEPAPAPEPAGQRTYVVQGGDTLSEIAQDELGSARRWREIAQLNPDVDPNRMREGIKLVLPGPTGATPAPATPRSEPVTPAPQPVAPRAGDGATYVVQNGDSLWRIAARTLGDGNRWTELRDANPSLNPDVLVEGMRIVLPGGATPRIASGAPTPERSPTRERSGVVR